MPPVRLPAIRISPIRLLAVLHALHAINPHPHATLRLHTDVEFRRKRYTSVIGNAVDYLLNVVMQCMAVAIQETT